MVSDSIRVWMNLSKETTVYGLTNTISWRTAWIQNSKHTERRQPQWSVSLPHPHSFSYFSFPHLGVSCSGYTSWAPLGVVWHIHYSTQQYHLKNEKTVSGISKTHSFSKKFGPHQISLPVWVRSRIQELYVKIPSLPPDEPRAAEERFYIARTVQTAQAL